MGTSVSPCPPPLAKPRYTPTFRGVATRPLFGSILYSVRYARTVKLVIKYHKLLKCGAVLVLESGFRAYGLGFRV
jgi:hypothetical protein